MLDYGVKDIKTLEGIEAIRLRPGMYHSFRKYSMILVKDLKATLRDDITIIINLGPDDNNVSRLTPDQKEYDNCTIDEIFFADKNAIGITIL